MNILKNFTDIQNEMACAAKDSHRNPSDITLVAVTKTHPAEMILPLLESGHRTFGENRVQEAASKWPELKIKYPEVHLHLIGPLQTNKIKEAVSLFDVIESVDRLELAEKLAAEMKKQNKNIPCFVQVNTGEEPQKAGISPLETVSFVKECLEKYHLNVIGLMCIPPLGEEPGPHFAFLKKLAQEAGIKELSMGMSEDFSYAIQQGATYIRVGSALFGERSGSHQ